MPRKDSFTLFPCPIIAFFTFVAWLDYHLSIFILEVISTLRNISDFSLLWAMRNSQQKNVNDSRWSPLLSFLQSELTSWAVGEGFCPQSWHGLASAEMTNNPLWFLSVMAATVGPVEMFLTHLDSWCAQSVPLSTFVTHCCKTPCALCQLNSVPFWRIWGQFSSSPVSLWGC